MAISTNNASTAPAHVAAPDTLSTSRLDRFYDRIRQRSARKLDLVLPARNLKARRDGTFELSGLPVNAQIAQNLAGLGVTMPEGSTHTARLGATAYAHGQLAGRLGIPVGYYRKMLTEQTPLLAENVNTWTQEKDRNLLFRIMREESGGAPVDGSLRAVLSDKYKFIDHEHVLAAALHTARQIEQETGTPIEVRRCDLTPKRMYLILNAPGLAIDGGELLHGYRNPHTGDRDVRITPGVVISNSEIGAGTFRVTDRPHANVCFNSLHWPAKAPEFSRRHAGSQLGGGNVTLSQNTRQKERDMLVSAMKDVMGECLSRQHLETIKADMLDKGTRQLEHPVEAAQNMAADLGFSEEETGDLVNHFVRGGDFRAVGLMQAATFAAQHVGDTDRRFEIEEDAHRAILDADRFDKVPA